ncbi:MAG TPA: hypothetical protein VF426_09005 [Marmoricola sp.]
METDLIEEVRQTFADVVDDLAAPAPDEVAIRRLGASYRRRRSAGYAAAIAAVAAVAAVAVVAVGVPGHGHDAAPAGPGGGTPPAHDLGSIPIMDDGLVAMLDLDTRSVHPTDLRLRHRATAHETFADGDLIGRVPGGFLATDQDSRVVRVKISGSGSGVAVERVGSPSGQDAVSNVVVSSDGATVAWVDTHRRLSVRSLTGSATGFGAQAFEGLHDPRVFAVEAGHVVYEDHGELWLQSGAGRTDLGRSSAIESAQLAGNTIAVLTSQVAGGADHATLYDLDRPRVPIAQLGAGRLSPDGTAFAQVAAWSDRADGAHQEPVVRIWHRHGATGTINGVPNVAGLVWLGEHTLLVASNDDPAEVYEADSTVDWNLAAMRVCDAGTGGCRTVWTRPKGAPAYSAQVVAPLQWSVR